GDPCDHHVSPEQGLFTIAQRPPLRRATRSEVARIERQHHDVTEFLAKIERLIGRSHTLAGGVWQQHLRCCTAHAHLFRHPETHGDRGRVLCRDRHQWNRDQECGKPQRTHFFTTFSSSDNRSCSAPTPVYRMI